MAASRQVAREMGVALLSAEWETVVGLAPAGFAAWEQAQFAGFVYW